MHKLELNTIETCPMKGKDVYLTGDLSDFIARADRVPTDRHNRKECTARNDWTGKQSYDDAVSFARAGDLKRVAPSDAWLSKFESLSPMRGAFQTVSDVTGSIPIVPTVLSGHPLAMRRRKRVASEQAPLAVCVDLVSSGGIDAKILEKRGALILALVRALSATRPVELWCGGSSYPSDNPNDKTYHVFFRMDTAPLDLARAAHVMTSPAVSRGMLYATIAHAHNENEDAWGLRWPYNDHAWARANMRPVLSRVIGTDDMLCIAAPYMADKLVNEPEAWFQDMLKQYGGLDDEA
jgi:hypothetical protein